MMVIDLKRRSLIMQHAERVGPGRRAFIALGVGAFTLAAIPLVRRRRRLVRRAVPIMGTVAELVVVHRDVWYAGGAIDAAIARLRTAERTLTRFSATSEIGRANARAAGEAVSVSAETAAVLRAAVAWADRTDGVFDPCLGRSIALWDVGARTAPPSERAVARFAGRGLYRALDIDTWRGRPAVRFTDKDVSVDLGGIGKGYGVDRAVDVLRDWGIRDAVVNLGGDLYAMGESVDGDAWRIGVRSPDETVGVASLVGPGQAIATIDVRDAAIATSGDYLQYFEYKGRRYHHLLDPSTGAPRARGLRTLTVQATDCMTADAAATAAFCASNGAVVNGRAEVIHSA